jgi:hypothetical protein
MSFDDGVDDKKCSSNTTIGIQKKYSVAQQDECCQIRAESVIQNTAQEWTT